MAFRFGSYVAEAGRNRQFVRWKAASLARTDKACNGVDSDFRFAKARIEFADVDENQNPQRRRHATADG